jgi:hypothetical protein
MTNETTQMHPLANDANGNPIDVPAEAAGWRVRKLARRAGRPKVLFDAETGRPLELPLAISYEDFVETVGEAGRYRLEAFNAHGQIIAGCVAVTEVALDGEELEMAMPQNPADTLPHLVQLVGKLVETNARVMEAMASAFGQVRPAALTPVVVERPAESKSEENPFVANMVQAFLQQYMAQKFSGAGPVAAAPAPTGAQS